MLCMVIPVVLIILSSPITIEVFKNQKALPLLGEQIRRFKNQKALTLLGEQIRRTTKSMNHLHLYTILSRILSQELIK